MLCKKCGASLREGAKFCPECGLMTAENLPPVAEYSYETLQKLFPLSAVIALLIIWLVFSAIGVLAALGSGFWYVGVIISGIVLFAILVVMWANKGKSKKWGKDRTLWVLTPEGYATGYPPDVAKRVAGIGAAGAAGGAKTGNAGVSLMGANIAAENIKTIVHGLPVMPWAAFINAVYRPEKNEIALHLPNGQVGLIKTNHENYAYVEQLVRGYMEVNKLIV